MTTGRSVVSKVAAVDKSVVEGCRQTRCRPMILEASPPVQSAAERLRATPAQILFRWLIQPHGDVDSGFDWGA